MFIFLPNLQNKRRNTSKSDYNNGETDSFCVPSKKCSFSAGDYIYLQGLGVVDVVDVSSLMSEILRLDNFFNF